MTTNLPDTLWVGTEQTRQHVLTTAFVNGIANRSLDPVKFCRYTIQDAIFVYKSKQSLDVALNKAIPGSSTAVLLAKLSSSYASYVDGMFKEWLIEENSADSAVIIGQACRDYFTYVQTVANAEESIYTLLAVLPCLRLWYWIGEQLSQDDKGIYTKWANNNFTGSSWKEIETEVQNAYLNNMISEDKATTIYNNCMNHERLFFDSVRF